MHIVKVRRTIVLLFYLFQDGYLILFALFIYSGTVALNVHDRDIRTSETCSYVQNVSNLNICKLGSYCVGMFQPGINEAITWNSESRR